MLRNYLFSIKGIKYLYSIKFIKYLYKVVLYGYYCTRILPLYIIVGYKAHLSAGLLAIFCIATAFIFHFDFNDQMQTIAFLKNIGLAGGFLFIVANGTKEWAIEREKKYVRL